MQKNINFVDTAFQLNFIPFRKKINVVLYIKSCGLTKTKAVQMW